jgi:hypothetical protein
LLCLKRGGRNTEDHGHFDIMKKTRENRKRDGQQKGKKKRRKRRNE